MRRKHIQVRTPSDSGQSLLETALVLPILLLLAFNAINFGYFVYVALNLASAPRSGVQYSILGFANPGQFTVMEAGPITDRLSVSFLTLQDVTRALPNVSNAKIIVCTKTVDLYNPFVSPTDLRVKCAAYGNGSETKTAADNADPEPSNFVLHQVDVYYTVTPLIPGFQLPMPGGPFNVLLLPNMRFHRKVSMRVMD